MSYIDIVGIQGVILFLPYTHGWADDWMCVQCVFSPMEPFVSGRRSSHPQWPSISKQQVSMVTVPDKLVHWTKCYCMNYENICLETHADVNLQEAFCRFQVFWFVWFFYRNAEVSFLLCQYREVRQMQSIWIEKWFVFKAKWAWNRLVFINCDFISVAGTKCICYSNTGGHYLGINWWVSERIHGSAPLIGFNSWVLSLPLNLISHGTQSAFECVCGWCTLTPPSGQELEPHTHVS